MLSQNGIKLAKLAAVAIALIMIAIGIVLLVNTKSTSPTGIYKLKWEKTEKEEESKYS